jgi:RNA polymerase sigma-70 factor, ECF subfamily
MTEGLAMRTSSRAPAGDVVPDRDLVLRAQSGDAEAFRMIFDRCATAIHRFTGDVLRDAALADEATQETFVRAHARLGSLREGEALLGWLFGIARLVSLEQLRERRRAASGSAAGLRPTTATAQSSEGPGTPGADPRPQEVDRAPTPEAALLTREADRHLDAALGELPGERRAALLLRLDHGLGYGEIAEAMGWSLAKVKNEIHRARVQLRATLAAYLGEA